MPALQMAEHSQRKLQEMDAVHERFKLVVQKKDKGHAALLAQFKEVQQQCIEYEVLLQQQQAQFTKLTGSL